MSPRKSDSPIQPAPDPSPSAAPAAGWRSALLVNLPLPILLLLMIPLGRFVEHSGYVNSYQSRLLTLIGYNIILAVSLQLINGFSGQFSLGHAGFMAVGAYLAAYPAINVANEYTNPIGVIWFYIALAVTAAITGGVIFLLFSACRASRKLHPSLPGLLMLLLLAWLMVDLARAARFDNPPGYYVWTHGFARVGRLLNTLLDTGGPIASRISGIFPGLLAGPLTFIALMVGAGCCAAATGFIVGLPALRLKGDYLAIATLGMGEIIRIIIINTPALGGALGLTQIPRGASFAWVYVTVILTVVIIWRIAYSSVGRAIMAVREDEIASAAVGLNNTRYKVTAFTIGAFFAGACGALFALDQYAITPSRFDMSRSIEIVVMVTLGGLGSISGAILAAVVLTLLPEVLRDIADYRMILYSLALILMMLLRPQGLLGGREILQFFRWRKPATVAEGPA